MNPLLRHVSCACVALIALGSSPPREELSFHPEEGSVLSKLFLIEATLELGDFTIIADGQDMSDMLGPLNANVVWSKTVGVTDRYGTIRSGLPDTLVRNFRQIEGESTFTLGSIMGTEQVTSEAESALEGRSVRFERDGDEGECSVSYDGEVEGEKDLIEQLEEEMDLRFMLPAEDVSVNDSWKLDVHEFAALIFPGGDLGLRSLDAEEDDGGLGFYLGSLSAGLGDRLEEVLEGSCECTLVDLREQDGVMLAEIGLALEVSSTVDLVDLLNDTMRAAKDGEGGSMKFPVADLNVDLEARGTLLWNLTGGHMHGFESTTTGVIDVDLSLEAESLNESHTAEVSAEFDVSMKHTASVE